jgi:hypothetical protein
MIPEDGEGGIVEGTKEAGQRSGEHASEQSGNAAPRAGMQGQRERGAAPTQTLERPGTTPAGAQGSGGGVDKDAGNEPPRAGGRVQDPKNRNTP